MFSNIEPIDEFLAFKARRAIFAAQFVTGFRATP